MGTIAQTRQINERRLIILLSDCQVPCLQGVERVL
jgi:hypothetical protein